jgi:hypothetical protein
LVNRLPFTIVATFSLKSENRTNDFSNDFSKAAVIEVATAATFEWGDRNS